MLFYGREEKASGVETYNSGVPAVPRLKTRTALGIHESCFSLKQVRSRYHARGGGVEIANKLRTSCCFISLQGYAVGRLLKAYAIFFV